MRILFFVLLLLKCACPLKVDALHSKGADVVGPGKEAGLGARHAALARALALGRPNPLLEERAPDPSCSDLVKKCTTGTTEEDCAELKKIEKLVECAKEFLPIFRVQKAAFSTSYARAKKWFESYHRYEYKGEDGKPDKKEMKEVFERLKAIFEGVMKLWNELKNYWTEFVLPVKNIYDGCARCQTRYGKFNKLDQSSP